MTRKIAIFAALILCSNLLCAQDFPSRIWHEGLIVTNEEDTLKGSVKYNMETDIVQLLVDEARVKTFNSKKVLYFEIFDNTMGSFRQFYSIPFQIRSDYKAPTFFEVLYEGRVTLLVKEKIAIDTDPYGQAAFYGTTTTSRERLDYTYYFVDVKGKMQEYRGRKNDLYEILVKNVDLVKDYIKSNNLKTDKMRDLVRITAFYNSL